MKNINQELLNHVILHKDRIPHYHKDFPLYYFGVIEADAPR